MLQFPSSSLFGFFKKSLSSIFKQKFSTLSKCNKVFLNFRKWVCYAKDYIFRESSKGQEKVTNLTFGNSVATQWFLFLNIIIKVWIALC